MLRVYVRRIPCVLDCIAIAVNGARTTYRSVDYVARVAW